ncbi:MAG: hypothetical protein J1F11_05495 [Oscillospiraceae bacterium]|nr:hypothetical protein [Oscillospiraceae bacterium]
MSKLRKHHKRLGSDDMRHENVVDLSYLNMTEKEPLEISYDCAQIYFRDKDRYEEDLRYLESSSYIIYNEADSIACIHKTTGRKFTIIDDLDSVRDMFDKKKITVYADMMFYVIGDDLYYVDLDTGCSGLVLSFDSADNPYNNKKEIKNICIHKSGKLIYKNGFNYIVDLKRGISSAKKMDVHFETENYFLIGDYVYYLEGDYDYIDERNTDKHNYLKYKIKRYSIDSGLVTDVSDRFGEADMTDSIFSVYYDLCFEGVFDHYYCVVFENSSIGSIERSGYHCFYVDLSGSGISHAHRFYIWNSHIYQIEQHRNNLIYVNADNGYKLVKHNFVSDKKSTIIRKYGMTEKSTFFDRFAMGKGEFQNPNKYMRLGNWLWIKETGKYNPQIIAV